VDHGKVEKNDVASLRKGIESIMRNVCGDGAVDTPQQTKEPSSRTKGSKKTATKEETPTTTGERGVGVDVKPPAHESKRRRLT